MRPSVGHIRDLPRSGLAIDVDDHFTPHYVVPDNKKKVVSDLRAALKNADELYLATDEDREGEAISWHLREVLKPRVPVKRMVFHEITPSAIREAVDHWRELDMKLVEAQEGRRVLDRLVGYELSPVLWRKVAPKLSAGRVQSVATRMLVERERARMAFRSADYWDIDGAFRAHGSPFHLSGRPGFHFGYGAYASEGFVVSWPTPAPWRSASSERGYTISRSSRREPVMKMTHGPSPAPTKACSVPGGQ